MSDHTYRYTNKIWRLGLILNVVSMCGLACSDTASSEIDQTRVGINTLREPFHKSDHTCGSYPPDYLEYLDDTKCKKILPSNRDREFTCPIQATTSLIESTRGYAPVDAVLSGAIDIDTETLKPIISQDISATVILIRRVDGVPYYRYLSNGQHSKILEMWSSSKFLGILNASEALRYESEGALGLDSSIDGIPVGDLVSVVHNYDERNYSSNGLMSWFHDVGGREFANQILHQRWLNRPETEVFGANYGAKSANLGFTFSGEAGEVKINPDQGWIKSNKLSTLTLAEALKRVVLYRENPATNLELSNWTDIKVLLYGAQRSIWYDELTPQGMEGDISIYMQESVDIHELERKTQGQWRIFSKLGLGFSRGGELVHTDYACFPSFDDNGEPQVNQGVEMVISMHIPANQDYITGDRKLANIYQQIVQAVWRGDIR
jgi:hypothetical protein